MLYYQRRMIEKTDEEIAVQVQKGDIESFGVLMERYEKKLTRYGKKFLADHEDTKDLVQEVFIDAYMNIKGFDASRKFSPWIYRMAHNKFINTVKKKWREMIFPFDLDLLFPQPIAKETADAELHKQDLKRMLDQCLEKIDSKYKEPLVLYYFEDMDYKEIADVLQIPISTVGIRLKRGRENLKKLVKKFDENYGQSKQ